jgi:hypothetical protein
MQPLRRITCSRAVRSRLLAEYPAAANDDMLRRALVYFAFGATRDRDSKRLLCSERHIRWIWGANIPHGWGSEKRTNSGLKILKDIRDRLLPGLEWTRPNKQLGQARTILTTGIRPAVQKLIDDDLRLPVKTLVDRVYVLDGLLYRKGERTAIRRNDIDQAALSSPEAPSPVTAYFLARLNNDADRPLRSFTVLETYVPQAIAAAQRYRLKSGDDDPCQRWKYANGKKRRSKAERTRRYRQSLLRSIRAIQDLPQPFYRPSSKGRTDRIFGLNASILDLPSEIRHTMTEGAGWVELDLTSAHLAIAAALWNLPGIRSLLESGASVWDHLIAGISTDVRPGSHRYKDLKAVLKTATYSAVFGMKTSSLRRKITCEMQLAGYKFKGAAITALPVFQELLVARTMIYAKIKTSGIQPAPTGIVIDPTRPPEKQMATLAQSYEAILMQPILQYEETEFAAARAEGRQPAFRVMLWQHDGCSLRFDKSRVRHTKGMQAAVASVATKYDIPTRLEVK